VLELLHNTGYPWGTATCAAAAMGGHLGRAVQVDPMKPMLKSPGTTA
jgi:hypothetical protein